MIEHPSQLLIAGAKSYPEAFAVLEEFRLSAQQIVESEVEGRKRAIAKLFAIPIDAFEIRPRFRPPQIGSKNKMWASIGVAIRRDECGWRQYHHLHWEGSAFGFFSSIRFPKDEARGERVWRNLRDLKPKLPLGFENREVYICREIDPKDMARMAEVVGKVIDEWIRLWQKGGSLK